MVGKAVVMIVTSSAARKTAIQSAAMMTASLPLDLPMILPLLLSSSIVPAVVVLFCSFSSAVFSGLESRAVSSPGGSASGSRVDEVITIGRFLVVERIWGRQGLFSHRNVDTILEKL